MDVDGDGELVSARDGSNVGFHSGGSLAKKLCHPLEEIRVRAFKTVLQKLDMGFVSVMDLGLQLEFVRACLKWFNFPTTTLRDEMLNLLLLISKEESGCRSMSAVGAMSFLTELRVASSALESQSIDTIMQNIVMKTSDSTSAQLRDADAVPFSPMVGKEPLTNNDFNDGNNNLPPVPNLEFQPPSNSLSCGGTPRGILRDVDPQLIQGRLNSVLSTSSPALPACDAATLTTAVQALYDASSAVSAADAVLGSEAADVISAATDAMKSTLTFVNGVVLKDFPVNYLLTSNAETCNGADVLGALIDSIVVWKEKVRRTTVIDVHDVIISLLETLEVFVEKLSESVADREGTHFRRQFLVASYEDDTRLLDKDEDEVSSDSPENEDETKPNPFRNLSEKVEKPALNDVNVSIASSVIIETLCSFLSDVLRPLENNFYQTSNVYDGGNSENACENSDSLPLHDENAHLLRLSVLTIDIVATSSAMLKSVALVELTDVDAYIHVYDRCLGALADAVGRLTWMENSQNVSTPRFVSARLPSRCQLLTYAHLGSLLAVLSRGFIEGFPSVAKSSSSTHLLPRPDADPHDLLPPSSISSLRLLAVDPFFHKLFPHARESAILPTISHESPLDAGKIVDALHVCAMLTETHFVLNEVRGASLNEPIKSLAPAAPYLAYTNDFGVIPNVVRALTRRKPSSFTYDVNTFLQLLAHPISTVRARVYHCCAEVVVESLQSALEKSVVENPIHEGLSETLGFLNYSTDDETNLWREMVLYGLNDPDTSGSVETILTAIIDHRKLIESRAFLDQLIQRFIIPLLPYLVGFAAPKHAFASTIRSIINDFSKSGFDDVERSDLPPQSLFSLKSTISLLYSREKDWRNEGLRLFLALTDAGRSFVSEASTVEVEIFADTFVRTTSVTRTNFSERSGKPPSSSLEDILRIFTNSSAAADVRSTAAWTLGNAVVDAGSYEAVWGDERALRTCLTELREADNAASPPVLSIDDVIPAVLLLLEKLVLDSEIRRRRWSSWDSSFKSAKGDTLSLHDLILTLCRLCVKYRKNSAAVGSLSLLFSAFAFADLEEKEVGRFGPPSYPFGLVHRYNIPLCTADEAKTSGTSANCDLSLLKVHQKLKDDGTLILVKHCWNSLKRGRTIDEDETTHLSPLDYSPDEDLNATLLDAGECVDTAMRHLEKAACHEDFVVAVSLLAFPALLAHEIEDGKEGEIKTIALRFLNLSKRFFESPPASAEDENLFILVLKLLKKQIRRRPDTVTIRWFDDLIFSDSFQLFLNDALASAVSSSSNYIASLLKFLAEPPTSSGYSLNVMTICVNWLGSGLDLSHPRVLPIVDSAAKLMSRTISTRLDVIATEGKPNGVLKEALKILCLHSSNVARLLLLTSRNEESHSLVFGSSAIESAAKALLASIDALAKMTTETEFSDLLESTVFVGNGQTPTKLWFLSALHSPSPVISSMFWSLLRSCFASSSSTLLSLLRQFPDFLRVCVEVSLDAVEVAPIVKIEILHCLMLSCDAVSGAPNVDEKNRSLLKMFGRYDLMENLMSSLDSEKFKFVAKDEFGSQVNLLKLRLLKWYITEQAVVGRRASDLCSYLVEVFCKILVQQYEKEEDTDGTINNEQKNDVEVEKLGALIDALLSLISKSKDKSLHDCFFSLDSSFFSHCFELFSSKFLPFSEQLWCPLMKLVSLLLADNSSSNVYPVAIAMLKHKDKVMDWLLVISSLPPQSLSLTTLASSYRWFAFLLTRLGRDSNCLEVLDGLFDIPHRIYSDETHGNLLASTIYQRFLYHFGDGRSVDPIRENGDQVELFGSQRQPPATIEIAAASLIKQLVVVSSTAKTTALFDLCLVERLVTDSLSLEAALSLDSLNGAHNSDGSISPSDGVLQRLKIHLSLLTNLLSESEEAKSVANSVDVNISLLFHRIWSWVSIDEALADAFFQCVGAFAADNPVGVANCLCANQRSIVENANHSVSRLSSSSVLAAGKLSPVSSSSSSSSALQVQTSSLIFSLTQYVSKLCRYPPQNLMLQRSFILLGKLASISAEVRGVLTKTHFLENGFCQLNPKNPVTSSSFPSHSAWLDFVCNLTLDTDGQLMVFKAEGAIDLLLEYLSLPNNASTAQSPSLSSLRQKAALALHNLCYSVKNVTLFARPIFLPTLIRRATTLPESQPTRPPSADQKTSLICCAALWALATRLKKNASLIKESNCRAKLQETMYKLSRRDDVEEEDTTRHLTYCKKIISVLDS